MCAVPPKVAEANIVIVTIMGIFNGIFVLNFANINIEFLINPNVKIVIKISMTATIAVLVLATL